MEAQILLKFGTFALDLSCEKEGVAEAFPLTTQSVEKQWIVNEIVNKTG